MCQSYLTECVGPNWIVGNTLLKSSYLFHMFQMLDVKNLTQIKLVYILSTYKNVLSKNKISQSKGPSFFHYLMKKTFIFESKRKVFWLLNSSISSPVFFVKNSSSSNSEEWIIHEENATSNHILNPYRNHLWLGIFKIASFLYESYLI